MDNQPTEATIALLGDLGAGKTSFSNRYTLGLFGTSYDPSVEDDFRTVEFNGTSVKLLLIELDDAQDPSKERLVAGCHGAVLMYNIASRSSFESLTTWKDYLLRHKDALTFPMVVVGTHCDEEGEKDRRVPSYEALDLQAQIGYPFIETSAKDGFQVDKSILLLLDEMKKYREQQAAIHVRPKQRGCVIS